MLQVRWFTPPRTRGSRCTQMEPDLLPLCFIVEEVTFRGALDSYLWEQGERGLCSALALSFLWALWHLPIQTVPINFSVALWPGVVHTAIGVPLAMSWRLGGNLAVPAAVHALLDGLRKRCSRWLTQALWAGARRNPRIINLEMSASPFQPLSCCHGSQPIKSVPFIPNLCLLEVSRAAVAQSNARANSDCRSTSVI